MFDTAKKEILQRQSFFFQILYSKVFVNFQHVTVVLLNIRLDKALMLEHNQEKYKPKFSFNSTANLLQMMVI